MRKYQQLLLVIISIISVTILLMYRSENSRLKYVLQVVNFLGRNDAAVVAHFENSTKVITSDYDFDNPLPVWQRISSDFYVYSSFWYKNELVSGGEISSIVVGIKNSMINFKCEIVYNNRKVIGGKFGFVRIELFEAEETNKNIIEDFSLYKFICKVSRDFGTPEGLLLTEIKAKSKHELKLRHIKSKEVRARTLMTACINLVPYNITSPGRDYMTDKNLQQFFFHHQAIGIDEFLIYNADSLSTTIKENLIKAGMRLSLFPYNFPFDIKTKKTRSIIEMDCLMRNINSAQYTILLDPNEFFYPSSNINFKGSPIRSLAQFNDTFARFEILGFSVCMQQTNKLLMDNILYDPDSSPGHKMFIYKPKQRGEMKTATINLSSAFRHFYINCKKGTEHDWRTNIREDFMQYIATIRNEINFS